MLTVLLPSCLCPTHSLFNPQSTPVFLECLFSTRFVCVSECRNCSNVYFLSFIYPIIFRGWEESFDDQPHNTHRHIILTHALCCGEFSQNERAKDTYKSLVRCRSPRNVNGPAAISLYLELISVFPICVFMCTCVCNCDSSLHLSSICMCLNVIYINMYLCMINSTNRKCVCCALLFVCVWSLRRPLRLMIFPR